MKQGVAVTFSQDQRRTSLSAISSRGGIIVSHLACRAPIRPNSFASGTSLDIPDACRYASAPAGPSQPDGTSSRRRTQNRGSDFRPPAERAKR